MKKIDLHVHTVKTISDEKFSELLSNKSRFLDESEAIYKDALQKYQV